MRLLRLSSSELLIQTEPALLQCTQTVPVGFASHKLVVVVRRLCHGCESVHKHETHCPVCLGNHLDDDSRTWPGTGSLLDTKLEKPGCFDRRPVAASYGSGTHRFV